ncbi:MAG: Eco57I restriction-modification methylase domain-containing protein [Bacteroidales bacterium]|nr:Eco57I restriction-modification methylase domain-containing protein [Bacteroidales bacterium]
MIKNNLSEVILEPIKFDKSLHQSYFKQSLRRDDIELFKRNFKRLLERISETESEEHNKNIVSDFLKNTFYKENFEINTADRKDLVIHKTNTSSSPVSVIIEAKSPSNKSEMISFDKPNAKALHETIHYYLKERIINQNKEIKHLIITNIYEWFIFDAVCFEQYFYANKNFRKSYQEWIDKELVGTKTDWFYTEIAKPFLDTDLETLPCVYINLLEYAEIVKNTDQTDDSKLINLYKIFSPEHLLKLPFANDYNKIDTGFYNELLHILGLEETKQGSKKLITRLKAKDREAGSFLENTIGIIQSLRRLNQLERPDLYGENEDEQLFSIALELNITWLNRVLFLKLLEAQLIKYHKGNSDYAFLNNTKIKDFDELNELFFEVLAKKTDKRDVAVQEKFGDLPYLNSSLFEQTHLESNVVYMSQLKDRLTHSISKQTVLKDRQGNKLSGAINPLVYLFEFLNAYSFASDAAADIQDDSRTIINAAVLGLIFEKINGYKDGSFYTPSFITTYMSGEVLKNALVTNFAKLPAYAKVESFKHLKECINYTDKSVRQNANDVINALKIVDPAVGSGHFLVSVLNELVALKSELRILQDQNGNRLRGIIIQNVNDELVIINEETSEPFQYYVNDKHIPPSEIQCIQQTLFNEKRTLIEKCIFGVDINPKSVLICRLRMWIELLKNSYYTAESNYMYLETLPNIDINIKAGNSLISKFDTGLNVFERAAVNKLIVDYKFVTDQYKKNTNYDEKLGFRKTIQNIKTELLKFAIPQDKHYKQYLKKSRELQNLIGVNPQSETIIKQITKLSDEIAELEKKYKDNYYTVYANSLEWSIDFPEILSENGEFVGFDVVIGNPPYFTISNEPKLKEVSDNYTTFKHTGDIYMLFIERGLQIIKPDGRVCMITSNKWMRAAYGERLRDYLLKNATIEKLIDFDGLKVFDEATVDTGIIQLKNHKNGLQSISAVRFDKSFDLINDSISEYFEKNKIELKNLTYESWNLKSENENAIKHKIEEIGLRLKHWNISISRGLTTGLNEAFVIDTQTKENLINTETQNRDFIKPLLRGRDIKKYNVEYSDLWLIIIPKGYTIKSFQGTQQTLTNSNTEIVSEPHYGYLRKADAWNYISTKLPSLSDYLQQFEAKADIRDDKGDFWWELRACSYYAEFEKEKIIFTKASQTKSFAYDRRGYYLQNTSYILSGENLKYLCGVLNSHLITYAFLNYYQSGGIDGEITVQAMHELPIPAITPENQATVNQIETLVDEIIELKEIDSAADIGQQTSKIDTLVYQLYDLTDEEIGMIKYESKC